MPKISFILSNGQKQDVEAPLGETILDIAHMHKIDLEGACDHSIACATCHVVVDPAWVDILPEPSADELDMLDLAVNLAPTSRLGCQITMREEYEGLIVSLPNKTA